MLLNDRIVDRDQRILAAYAAGQAVLHIAIAEGLPQRTIRAILRRHGVLRSGRRINPRPSLAAAERLADVDWLAAEYATKNIPQIARELGVSNAYVRSALECADIPVRSLREAALVGRGLKDRSTIQARATALYLAGSSVKAIAAELGYAPHQISNLLRELRVLGRRRKRPRE